MNENKLPEDFKKKWVAALRSGKYKQGKDVLYNPESDTFCCLGVAGIVCGLEKHEMSDVDIITVRESCMDEPKATSSRKALNELQYPRFLAADNISTVGTRLANMNDDGKSFSEIADWIEQNL